jgi:hypothetical protein
LHSPVGTDITGTVDSSYHPRKPRHKRNKYSVSSTNGNQNPLPPFTVTFRII